MCRDSDERAKGQLCLLLAERSLRPRAVTCMCLHTYVKVNAFPCRDEGTFTHGRYHRDRKAA